MFFFRILWALLSVGIRLVVVAAPFIYVFMQREWFTFGAASSIPGYVLAPVYSLFAFFLLFWRGIATGAANHQAWLAQLSDEDREAYFSRMEAEEEQRKADDDDNPGVPLSSAWYRHGNDRM